MYKALVFLAILGLASAQMRLDPFGPICLENGDCTSNNCLNAAGADQINGTYFFCSEPAACVDTAPRTIDGNCNNVEAGRRLYGSRTHLQTPVISPLDGELGVRSATPSTAGPRMISDEVNQQYVSTPNQFGNSHLLITMGQFVDHDFTLLDLSMEAGATITGSGDLQDFEIVPSAEMGGFFPNAITAWLDLSQVYGSDTTTAASLRASSGGLLLSVTRTDGQEYMPLASVTGTNVAMGPMLPEAFAAGDIRVNEQPILMAYHTLFVREHNRLAASNLCNGRINTEEIFQCARRWNIAQWQNIIFNEYFPAVHGTANGLPTFTGYNSSVQPDLSVLFSTASYRFGHSGIMDELARITSDGRTRLQALRAGFFNPNDMENIGGIDGYFRGALTQCHESIDASMVDSMRNFLFDDVPAEGTVDTFQGMDLAALNIERGREHGIESYNEARRLMGLNPYTTFDQVVGTGRQFLVDALNRAYGTNNVAQCDVWVCALSEPATRGQMGETMFAFQLDQFTRLRDGDRFYFENTDVMVVENGVTVRAFSDADISTISNTFLDDIITRNTAIATVAGGNAFDTTECCESNGVTTMRQICVPSDDGMSATVQTQNLDVIDMMVKSLDTRAFFPGTTFRPTMTAFDCNCNALDMAPLPPVVATTAPQPNNPTTQPGGTTVNVQPSSASTVSGVVAAVLGLAMLL